MQDRPYLLVRQRLSPPAKFAPAFTEITEHHAPVGGVLPGSRRSPVVA
jgi:hypothetical protein